MKKGRDIFDDFAEEIRDNTEMLHEQGASYAECRNFEIMSILLPLIGSSLRFIRALLAFCIGTIVGSLLSELLRALIS